MLALLGQLDIYCWPKGPTKYLQGIICWPYWDHDHGRMRLLQGTQIIINSGRTLAFAVSLPPDPSQASGEMQYKHKLPQSQGRAH